MAELFRQLENALLEPDYQAKCELTATIHQAWLQGSLVRRARSKILSIDDPGSEQI